MILQNTFVHIKTDKDKLSPITQICDRLTSHGIPHKKALTAAGNKMARMVYTILKKKEPYKF